MQEYKSPAHTELCTLVHRDSIGVDPHDVDEACGAVCVTEEERVIRILDSLKADGGPFTPNTVLNKLIG